MINKEEYKICKLRGHQVGGVVSSRPTWNICKHCSMLYRFENTLIESEKHIKEVNAPEVITKTTTLRKKGKPFWCICSANLFTQYRSIEGTTFYTCNGCGWYYGEEE